MGVSTDCANVYQRPAHLQSSDWRAVNKPQCVLPRRAGREVMRPTKAA